MKIPIQLNYAFGNFFDVARTSVRLHPMRTKVHTTTATLKFLNIKCTHRLFRWKRPTTLLKHQPMIKSNDIFFFFSLRNFHL